MHKANPAEPHADPTIAGAEAEGALDQWNIFLYGSQIKFALAKMSVLRYPIAIQRNYCLVFGDSLVKPALRTQHFAFGGMRISTTGRCR
jgi:hypothetical protein